MQNLPLSRQSRRHGGLPLKTPSSGLTCSRAKAQEYSALVLALMVALGVEHRFLQEHVQGDIQLALALLFITCVVLKQPFYKRLPHNETVRRMEQLCRRYRTLVEARHFRSSPLLTGSL